jgi:hypothetical protein
LRAPRIVINESVVEAENVLTVACPACGSAVNAVVDGDKARWACPQCLLVGVAPAVPVQLPLLVLPFPALPPASA